MEEENRENPSSSEPNKKETILRFLKREFERIQTRALWPPFSSVRARLDTLLVASKCRWEKGECVNTTIVLMTDGRKAILELSRPV